MRVGFPFDGLIATASAQEQAPAGGDAALLIGVILLVIGLSMLFPALRSAWWIGLAIVRFAWAIALIAAGAALAFYMTDLPLSPLKLKYYSWHKWIGVSIFIAVVVRLAWRLRHPAPPLPTGTPAWQLRAAHGAHLPSRSHSPEPPATRAEPLHLIEVGVGPTPDVG